MNIYFKKERKIIIITEEKIIFLTYTKSIAFSKKNLYEKHL